MAERTFFPAQAVHNEIKLVTGRFLFNGTSNPVTTYGIGYTVTRTGVGTYNITLNDKYAEFHNIDFSAGHASPKGWQVTIAGLTVGGAAQNVIQIAYFEQDTTTTKNFIAVDPAASANNWLGFEIVFRNTAIAL